ncbi:hypothetical protein [Litoreibacter arenae]|uniref:Putative Peptidase family C9 n=1 Tax=Litoreibacter arenae DSM 19593 TaxID=1123360 RepID=S9RYN4_9RHOB|nr:hypothetical protein [Litoreibacter arenae]EPX79074.1 putative Peptidase family C9 [Litoreibacter arenae DSM 19593]
MRIYAFMVATALVATSTAPAQAQTGVRFQSCGTAVKEKLIEAYRFLNTRRGSQRSELENCMDRAYVVEHQRHGPKKMVENLRRAAVTTFQCRKITEADGRAHRTIFKRGKLKIDRDFVRDNDRDVVASLIAHELMHNAGYKHSSNDKGSDLYDNTVPQQMMRCVQRLQPYDYAGPGRGRYDATKMLGFALDGENNYVFGWDVNGTAFAGSTTRIHNYRHPYPFLVAPGVNRNDIVGFGLDGFNNMVFAWLRDGRVIAGSTSDLDSKRAPYRYRLPSGYTPNDIVGMGVDGENNNNFAWYRDGRVSVGTSDNLGSRRAPYRYTLAPGYTPNDVVGMAVDGENNMIFAFYRDGKVSAGTSDDLDKFRAPARVITGR